MKFVLGVLVFIFNGSLAFGHGEDKPGPSGGYIRMPGAFHTEVVKTGKSSAKIYLLDINWKDPMTKNSSIEVEVVKAGKGLCKPQGDQFFLCNFPKHVDLGKNGELKIVAERNGIKGNSVVYELPLRLQKIDDGHGHH